MPCGVNIFQCLARTRVETRLLSGQNGGGTGGSEFRPRLETERDPLAPVTSSRLKLVDELDTYIDRCKVSFCSASFERSKLLPMCCLDLGGDGLAQALLRHPYYHYLCATLERYIYLHVLRD